MIFECDIVHVCRRSRLGAWIEIFPEWCDHCDIMSRSRLGAWIEIFAVGGHTLPLAVAPVWERGLKYNQRTRS